MIEFTVPGKPATQGSTKAFVRGGRAVVTHDSARTLPWRNSVRAYALGTMRRRTPLDCPVRVSAEFYLRRPKGRPKRETEADRKPDLDKLCRALGDALEGVVVTNDSRIVEWRARKLYGEPRTVVRVEAV